MIENSNCNAQADEQISNKGWYLSFLFAIFFVLSFVDRQIIAILVPQLKQDMGLTDLQISYLSGLSFVIFYTVLGLPIGRLVDIYCRKCILWVGILIWTVSTALCGVAGSYWHLLLLRMGVGVGEAALAPSSFSILADIVPPKKLATAIGVCTTGAGIGIAMAYMGGGFILKWAAMITNENGLIAVPLLGELAPWRIVFLVVGIPGIILSLLLLTFREPLRKTQVITNTDSKRSSEPEAPAISDVIDYVRSHWRAFLCIYVGTGFVSLSVYAGAFWDIVFFNRVYGWAPENSGIYYGLFTLFGQVIGNLGGGFLADYLSNRRGRDSKIIVLVFAAFFSIWFKFTYPFMSNHVWAMTLIIPAVLLNSVPYGIVGAAIQLMTPVRMRGQMTAAYYFVQSLIGLGLGPTAVAFFTEQVFSDHFMVGYSIAIVGGSAQVVATIMFFLSLKPYQKAVDAAKKFV